MSKEEVGRIKYDNIAIPDEKDPFWRIKHTKKEERLEVQSFYSPDSVNEFLRTTPIIKVEKLDTNLFLDTRGFPRMVYTVWYWSIVKEGEE